MPFLYFRNVIIFQNFIILGLYTEINGMKQTPGPSSEDKTSPLFDYRGLKCPLPVLKARRALSQLEAGANVTILADDPASPLDMAHFCQTEGHHLLASQEVDGFYRFILMKAS
jgi:tRNA 2-thiouridine synthesizing protein A